MEPSTGIAVVLVVLFGLIFLLTCTCYRFTVSDVGRLASQRLHPSNGRTADTRSDAPPAEHQGGEEEGGEGTGGAGAASNAVTA